MDSFWKTTIWQQYGAAIDMLGNAMRDCPGEVWSDGPAKKPEWKENDVVGFWYVAYHTLFFLDLYLSGSAKGFAPPAPFTMDELSPEGLLPEKPYTKEELLGYLDHCRKRCRATIEAMTDEQARQRCGFRRLDLSCAELLLYSMRHVQHHAAQLNLLLRQKTASAPRWVSKATDNPAGA
jgi:hypothetical protein